MVVLSKVIVAVVVLNVEVVLELVLTVVLRTVAVVVLIVVEVVAVEVGEINLEFKALFFLQQQQQTTLQCLCKQIMDMLRGIINCDVCLFQHVLLTVTCAPVVQCAQLATMDTRWKMTFVTVSIKNCVWYL